MAKRSDLLADLVKLSVLVAASLLPLIACAGDAKDTVDQATLDRAYAKLRAKEHAVPTTATATTQSAHSPHGASLRGDAPPAIKQLWKDRERFRKERLAQLATDEKSARQSAAQAIKAKDLQEAAASQKRVREVQQEEARVRSAVFVLPSASDSRFDLSQFKEGFIGVPPELGVKQVIDAKTLLAAVIDPSEFFTTRAVSPFEIAPGDKSAPTISEAYDRATSKAIDRSGVIVWIYDYDIRGLVDGKFFPVPVNTVIWWTEQSGTRRRTVRRVPFSKRGSSRSTTSSNSRISLGPARRMQTWLKSSRLITFR